MPRWIDDRTAEQSARLYHKVDNARGSDYARYGAMVLNVAETTEEELVDTTRGCQVGARAIEIGYGAVRHGCSTNDVMKGQAK